jgi:hypothetical protein
MSAATVAQGTARRLDSGLDATVIGGARVSDAGRLAQSGAVGALARARKWVRLGQEGAFYALLACAALALIGAVVFIIGAAFAIPFPDVRALWGLPVILLCGGTGGGAATIVLLVALYTARHLLEDARWALFGAARLEE